MNEPMERQVKKSNALSVAVGIGLACLIGLIGTQVHRALHPKPVSTESPPRQLLSAMVENPAGGLPDFTAAIQGLLDKGCSNLTVLVTAQHGQHYAVTLIHQTNHWSAAIWVQTNEPVIVPMVITNTLPARRR